MKVPNAAYFVAMAVVAVYIAYTIIMQLNTDASAAAAQCTLAERQGAPCVVGAQKYEAQAIEITDAAGVMHAYLVVSQGGKTVTLIALN